MKHLKKFNESKLGDELEEFCKEYLAYLTDGKFDCYVNSNSTNTHITILDRDYSDNNFNLSTGFYRGRDFNWSEIEDDFIPFLQILSQRYVISHGSVILTGYGAPVVLPNQYNKLFSIRDVIKGEIPNNATCNSVTLQIDRKASHTDIR
jgi:hypothetical protein